MVTAYDSTFAAIVVQAGVDAIRRTVPCARAVTEATLQPLDAEERARLIALLRKLA